MADAGQEYGTGQPSDHRDITPPGPTVLPHRSYESPDTPDEAAIIEHQRESQPALAWRDTGPAPQPAPVRLFEINDAASDFWLKAEMKRDGTWWLHFQLSAGRLIDERLTPEEAKQAALRLLTGRLERVLDEVRRGVV